MSEIGKKIKELRKKKGLSQEELAESSKVNLRTIQRIEKGECEPRGKTLSLICETLHVNIEDILDYGKQTNNSYLTIFHLSVITFLFIPVGNIIIPLFLWINKKDNIIGLKKTGINVLNFQILWSIVTYGLFFSYALLKIMHYKFHVIPFYMFIALYIMNIIIPINHAIKTKKGIVKNSYPVLLNFLK